MNTAFLAIVYVKNDGTIDKSTSGYNSMDEAEIAFHVALASAMQKNVYTKVIAKVFDLDGVDKFRRVWAREN